MICLPICRCPLSFGQLIFHSLVVVSTLIVLAGNLSAQSAAGSLGGTVTDKAGGVIPGVDIEIENVGTALRRSTNADEAGRYAFPQLAPGTYSLTARQAGFADVVIPHIELRVNTASTLNIVFEQLASVSETVTISAETAQVNTSDASVGAALGTRPILQLPLNARNPAGLLSLQPGVTFLSADPLDVRSSDIRNGAVNGSQNNQSNITLDGVDVNDQNTRFPFTSVLRNTLDSIQEFRVVTTTANADMGRSSGAQISLVTKSGTNELHGSLYEFHRNTKTPANEFFNNRSGIERAKLIRNVFGGSAGGPIVRNRAFFFVNYEGRRDTSETAQVREVPTASLRNGTVKYLNLDGDVSEIGADFLRLEVDPLGIGPSPAALAHLRAYPAANDSSIGDGLNFSGFRFSAPTPLVWNTYVAKLDWNADRNGNHQMFLRGSLQDDKQEGAPQFPGGAPNETLLDNSRGLAFGYTAVLGPTAVSSFRYGFTRQGLDRTGSQASSQALLSIASPLFGNTRGLISTLPVHTLSEDVTLTRGGHSVQFGGVFRSVSNRRSNLENSFHSAQPIYWALEGGGSDLWEAVPDLSDEYVSSYSDAVLSVLGVLNSGMANYNYDINGNGQPVGAPVQRTFGMEEYEIYVQDTWRAKPGMTLTAGLRWALMPPVREVNGVQVSLTPGYDEFVTRRVALAEAGLPSRDAGLFSFVPRDHADGQPLYPSHRKNFAPRIALAYSPQKQEGWLGKLFGGPGKTSIRAGAGLFYDVFGMGIMRTLDNNAFGLSSRLETPLFSYSSATAPRFTGPFALPGEIIPEAPPGGPGAPPDAFVEGCTVDSSIRPPYSINLTFSIGRELRGGFLVEGAYVGRLSRRTLVTGSGATQ